jgi:S1-C subfamily serine protease
MTIQGPDPSSITELLRLGHMGLDLGYWGQAEGYFDQVLALQPGQREALLGKAAATRDAQQGLALVAQVLARNEADVEARALQMQLRAQVNAGRVESHPHRTDPKAPEKPDVRRQGARATIRRDRWASAKLLGTLLLLMALIVALTLAARGALNGESWWKALWRGLPNTPTAQRVSQPTDQDLSVMVPLDRAQRSTVLVLVPDPNAPRTSRGSGVVVSQNGLVLTNYHVLTDEGGVRLNEQGLALIGLTRDVRQPPDEWYMGALVAQDDLRDLAVLRLVADRSGRPLQQARFDAIPLANSDDLHLGQSLIGLGFPTLGGETLTLTRGSMAGFVTNDASVQLGKTDSDLLPGSSGGAVLNQQGELVGVVTSAHTEERTQGRLSYFVLANETRDIIKTGQQAPRPAPPLDWLVAVAEQVLR